MIIELPEEQWKTLTYPGIRKDMYKVSNRGRIKNISKGNIISGYKHKSGYIYVNLMTDSEQPKSSVFKMHRLVAWEFVNGYSEEKSYVNHIDGNKANNYSYNLEWCTFAENIRHAFITGLQSSRKGSNNANARLSPEDVPIICRTIAHFKGDLKQTYDQLLKIGMNVKYSHITSIKYKRIWKDISDMYFICEELPKDTRLTPNDIELISKELKSGKGYYQVYTKLKNIIPNLSRSKVYRISVKIKRNGAA